MDSKRKNECESDEFKDVNRIVNKLIEGNSETATYAEKLLFGVVQSRRGSRPKKRHLTNALKKKIRSMPEASARELWDSLDNYNEDNLRIRIVGDIMEWDYEGTHSQCGDLAFQSFSSKVSRLRREQRAAQK